MSPGVARTVSKKTAGSAAWFRRSSPGHDGNGMTGNGKQMTAYGRNEEDGNGDVRSQGVIKKKRETSEGDKK